MIVAKIILAIAISILLLVSAAFVTAALLWIIRDMRGEK